MSDNDKNDPNKKHYFDKAELNEFSDDLILLCQKEEKQYITIWEKGEDENLAELYEAQNYIPETKILKLNPTGNLVTKITGSTKTGKNVLLKVPIENKLNFFTNSTLRFHKEDLTYSVILDQEVFKAQQRKSFRLNATSVIRIQFKIDNQVFEGLDISVGGTSFLVDKAEANRFKKGALFPECTLRFDRTNYFIPTAQIAGHFPAKDEKGEEKLKIGISFKSVPRKTEDELYIKITNESRAHEMMKKIDTILARDEKPE